VESSGEPPGKDGEARVTRRRLNPSLRDSQFPKGRAEGLRFDDFCDLVDDAMSHCWGERLLDSNRLNSRMDACADRGGKHLVPPLQRWAGLVFSPFGILDAVDALKVKLSLEHALPGKQNQG
jgi:hypothetical protein